MNDKQITLCELSDDPFESAKHCGYILITYKDFSETTGTSIKYIMQKYNNDGFVFWSEYYKDFVICYNETRPPKVIRQTIMHEIAHIALGHIKTESPIITGVESFSPLLDEIKLYVFRDMANREYFRHEGRNYLELEADVLSIVFTALSMYEKIQARGTV